MYTSNVGEFVYGYFEIENIQIEHITHGDEFGFVMAYFDLVTERGRVSLSENLNYDSHGYFESVERVDSNITINEDSRFCSVFDIDDSKESISHTCHPLYDVFEALEEEIMELPRKQRRHPRLEDLDD